MSERRRNRDYSHSSWTSDWRWSNREEEQRRRWFRWEFHRVKYGWWTPMRRNIARQWFVTDQMKDVEMKSGISLKKFSRLITIFCSLADAHHHTGWLKDSGKQHVPRMWCVQVNFSTRHHWLCYVLDTHDSSINKQFSLLSVSFLCRSSARRRCTDGCMINSTRTRSRRLVISCNNTSRRAQMNPSMFGMMRMLTPSWAGSGNQQKLPNDSGKRAK